MRHNDMFTVRVEPDITDVNGYIFRLTPIPTSTIVLNDIQSRVPSKWGIHNSWEGMFKNREIALVVCYITKVADYNGIESYERNLICDMTDIFLQGGEFGGLDKSEFTTTTIPIKERLYLFNDLEGCGSYVTIIDWNILAREQQDYINQQAYKKRQANMRQRSYDRNQAYERPQTNEEYYREEGNLDFFHTNY